MPEIADAAEIAVKMCSKCKQNPRADADGTNPWCLDCRADYQRAYNEGKAERLKDTGFSKGVEAMRRALLQAMGGLHPAGQTTNGLIVEWIRDFPTPRP